MGYYREIFFAIFQNDVFIDPKIKPDPDTFMIVGKNFLKKIIGHFVKVNPTGFRAGLGPVKFGIFFFGFGLVRKT